MRFPSVERLEDRLVLDAHLGDVSYALIQDAINNAWNGATIVVDSDTYNESLVIDRDVTLTGTGSVVLQGEGAGTGITIDNPAANVTLRDLALQGWATGLSASGLSTLTLQNISLTGNASGGTLEAIGTVDYTPTAATVAASVELTGDSFRSGTDDALGYSQVAHLNVFGSDEADHFTVAPPPAEGTIITVDGGGSPSVDAAGDSFHLDLTGVSSPLLTVHAAAEGYAGTWTAENRQEVNFLHMETLTPDMVLEGSGMGLEGAYLTPLAGVTVAQFTFLNNTHPADTFRATIHWGDDTSSTGEVVRGDIGYLVQGSHAYSARGAYPISVEVSGAGVSATLEGSVSIGAAASHIVFRGDGYVARDNRYTFSHDGSAHEAQAGAVGVEDADLGDATVIYYAGSYASVADLEAAIEEGTAVALDGPPLAAGTYTVYATYVGSDDYTAASAIAALEIANPAPVITELSPATLPAGSEDFALIVNGSGFLSSSVVHWNGTALTTTYVSDNKLTAVVPAAHLSEAGTAQVTVVNPTPGGGTSSAQTFTVSATEPHTDLSLQGSGRAVNGTQLASLDGVTVAQFTVSGDSQPAGTFAATVHWGDGTSSQGIVVQTEGGYLVQGSHTYTRAGTFTVSVDVTGAGVSATFGGSASITGSPLPSGVTESAAANFVHRVFTNLLHQPAEAAVLQNWSGVMGLHHLLSFQYFANLGVDPLNSLTLGAAFAQFNVTLAILKGSSPLESLVFFNFFLGQGFNPFFSSILATSFSAHGSAFTPTSGSPSERIEAYYRDLGLPMDDLASAYAQSLSTGLSDEVVLALLAAQHGARLS